MRRERESERERESAREREREERERRERESQRVREHPLTIEFGARALCERERRVSERENGH